MSCLLLTLLFAASPAAGKAVAVPQVEACLKKKDVDGALKLLKKVAAMKGNDAEAKALVRMIRDPRIEKPTEVMEASFLALKGIGSRKVTRDLLEILEKSDLRKEKAVRIGICRALQGSADPAAIHPLLDLLKDKEDRVIAASAEALSVYRYAKEPVRKEIFEKVMNLYVGTWNLKESLNPKQKVEKERAGRRWEVVAKSLLKCMQLLSNVTQEDPPAWRRWWNKNKYKHWTELERPQ